MKIAITADPMIPVPPQHYGGIERIIAMLIDGLVSRGHEVTLFAHPASKIAGRLVPYRGTRGYGALELLGNMMTVTRDVLANDVDIIHSFGRVAYLLPVLPLSIPKLMTYQREVTPSSIAWGTRLSRGTLHFSGISEWMMQETLSLGHWHKVFNGVPLATYDFVPVVANDAPLVFLGRIEHIKGTHLAIEIARRCGRKLVIAGNIPRGEEPYFNQQVQPFIDGDRVTYVGPVDDSSKNRLLGAAAAFLMPILWEEPFGIVMAEAMACGTPVLGLRRGSVPEVVEDGVTGFVRDDLDALVESVAQLPSLQRQACRQRVERLFSDTAVVDEYLKVYAGMCAQVHR